MTSITSFFRSLGAPLVNSRWSWGASNDDYIILRVWRDETVTVDGKMRSLVYNPQEDIADKMGQRERQKHLDAVATGKPCYLIMCTANRHDALTRKIQSFDTNRIFIGGNLIANENGSKSIEISAPIKVMEFLDKYNIRTKYLA